MSHPMLYLMSHKDPTSGFLSRSSDVLDVLGETRQGSGQIAYKLHSRSHHKPLHTKRSLRTMRAKVDSFVTQMQVEEFVPPERVLSITSGISFNGKSWAKGTGCLFRQDDDAQPDETQGWSSGARLGCRSERRGGVLLPNHGT